MQKNMKNAFTMIELVFVIVVLGILAAIAVPKFSATRTDAQIAKARSDISSIRSSIVTERQSRLIRGDSAYISGLSQGTDTLFDGNDSSHQLLTYGVASGSEDGHWTTTDTSAPYKNYEFHISGLDVAFDYNATNGKFICDPADSTTGDMCKKLVN